MIQPPIFLSRLVAYITLAQPEENEEQLEELSTFSKLPLP